MRSFNLKKTILFCLILIACQAIKHHKKGSSYLQAHSKTSTKFTSGEYLIRGVNDYLVSNKVNEEGGYDVSLESIYNFQDNIMSIWKIIPDGPDYYWIQNSGSELYLSGRGSSYFPSMQYGEYEELWNISYIQSTGEYYLSYSGRYFLSGGHSQNFGFTKSSQQFGTKFEIYPYAGVHTDLSPNQLNTNDVRGEHYLRSSKFSTLCTYMAISIDQNTLLGSVIPEVWEIQPIGDGYHSIYNPQIQKYLIATYYSYELREDVSQGDHKWTLIVYNYDQGRQFALKSNEHFLGIDENTLEAQFTSEYEPYFRPDTFYLEDPSSYPRNCEQSYPQYAGEQLIKGFWGDFLGLTTHNTPTNFEERKTWYFWPVGEDQYYIIDPESHRQLGMSNQGLRTTENFGEWERWTIIRNQDQHDSVCLFTRVNDYLAVHDGSVDIEQSCNEESELFILPTDWIQEDPPERIVYPEGYFAVWSMYSGKFLSSSGNFAVESSEYPHGWIFSRDHGTVIQNQFNPNQYLNGYHPNRVPKLVTGLVYSWSVSQRHTEKYCLGGSHAHHLKIEENDVIFYDSCDETSEVVLTPIYQTIYNVVTRKHLSFVGSNIDVSFQGSHCIFEFTDDTNFKIFVKDRGYLRIHNPSTASFASSAAYADNLKLVPSYGDTYCFEVQKNGKTLYLSYDPDQDYYVPFCSARQRFQIVTNGIADLHRASLELVNAQFEEKVVVFENDIYHKYLYYKVGRDTVSESTTFALFRDGEGFYNIRANYWGVKDLYIAMKADSDEIYLSTKLNNGAKWRVQEFYDGRMCLKNKHFNLYAQLEKKTSSNDYILKKSSTCLNQNAFIVLPGHNYFRPKEGYVYNLQHVYYNKNIIPFSSQVIPSNEHFDWRVESHYDETRQIGYYILNQANSSSLKLAMSDNGSFTMVYHDTNDNNRWELIPKTHKRYCVRNLGQQVFLTVERDSQNQLFVTTSTTCGNRELMRFYRA